MSKDKELIIDDSKLEEIPKEVKELVDAIYEEEE